MDSRNLKFESRGHEILYSKYKKLPKMSDSETKQLHIFLRKGLKSTYIDPYPQALKVCDQNFLIKSIYLFLETRNRDIFIVRYVKVPMKTLSPIPQQNPKGLTRKRARYKEVVKITPAAK